MLSFIIKKRSKLIVFLGINYFQIKFPLTYTIVNFSKAFDLLLIKEQAKTKSVFCTPRGGERAFVCA